MREKKHVFCNYITIFLDKFPPRTRNVLAIFYQSVRWWSGKTLTLLLFPLYFTTRLEISVENVKGLKSGERTSSRLFCQWRIRSNSSTFVLRRRLFICNTDSWGYPTDSKQRFNYVEGFSFDQNNLGTWACLSVHSRPSSRCCSYCTSWWESIKNRLFLHVPWFHCIH